MTETHHSSEPIKLEQATLLAEVEVYLEFGYKDQAAQALRDYLTQTPNAAPEQHQALLALYLELDTLNDFAEALTDEYHRGILPLAQLNQMLQRALQIEPDHMILQALAEQHCPEALLEEHRQAVQTTVNTQPKPVKTPAQVPATPRQHLPTFVAADTTERYALVSGNHPLTPPLTPAEQSTVRALLPPAARAHLLFSGGHADAAIRTLTRELKTSKRPLTPLVSLLRLCFLSQDTEAYARFLWQLNQILAPHGDILRRRLLSYGQLMGAHPLFTALKHDDSGADTRQIGLELGYLSSAADSEKLPLVDRQQSESPGAADQQPSPLQEAEDRLNDGQIPQAMLILENALLYNPEDLSLYPALFTLYEKTEDIDRLKAFSQKLRTSHQLLPAEAMLTMSQLHERMQTQAIIV